MKGPREGEKRRQAGNLARAERVATGKSRRRKRALRATGRRRAMAVALGAWVAVQAGARGQINAAAQMDGGEADDTETEVPPATEKAGTVGLVSSRGGSALAAPRVTSIGTTATTDAAASTDATAVTVPFPAGLPARATSGRPPRSEKKAGAVDKEARAFLDVVTPLLARGMTASAEADWTAARDETPEHGALRRGAAGTLAGLLGAPALLTKTRSFLDRQGELSPLTARQLKVLLSLLSDTPGTIPDVVAERVSLEEEQARLRDGQTFCLVGRLNGRCPHPSRPSEVDDILLKSRDLGLRARAWAAAKDVGPSLKSGLARLQRVRNRIARELGFSSFWALRTADYDVSSGEMMALLDRTVEEVKPLYDDLHCWARATLASRYGRPMPKMLPAHWLANRWGQTWPELGPGRDLAPYFKGAAAATLLTSADKFYTSLGFPALPPSFWSASDPYPSTAEARRLKNKEASAWHIDRDQDVRVLMNVVPSERWFESAHHELAHVHYFLSYARAGVPWLLRQGANRSFHEALAELARLAGQGDPYLKRIGVLPANLPPRPMETLLAEALEAVVSIPFSAGVMSHFERDLYETELPPEDWQQRWWDYVALYQGIEPPAPRAAVLCDACTKPHLAEAPAQYYDFTLVTLTKFQLHEHICTRILHQDVHACDYGGHKEVGAFLRGVMALGATRDWRELIEEATGEPLGAGALLRYFSPLVAELRRLNASRNCQR